jgi:molecular chaperone IbpA
VARFEALGTASSAVRSHVAQMEDVAMNLNFDPFWRSSVGFDRVLDLMDETLRYQPENNYPPYNILRTGDNSYRISLAVAGFKPDQINVTVHQNTLIVSGHVNGNQSPGHEFVHRGIAARDFERRFGLADFVEVKNASFEDGLLQIDLMRELPEAMKPKRIEIRSGVVAQDNQSKTIEHRRAAS